MSFGYKLTTIAPFEVKVFVTETSDSSSDADFWGSKKVEKILKFFSLKTLMFDPNVFNDSKQVLNDCFGSEKLFIIKQKNFTLDSHKWKET